MQQPRPPSPHERCVRQFWVMQAGAFGLMILAMLLSFFLDISLSLLMGFGIPAILAFWVVPMGLELRGIRCPGCGTSVYVYRRFDVADRSCRQCGYDLTMHDDAAAGTGWRKRQ